MRPETKHSLILLFGTGVTAAFSLVYAAVAGKWLGPERYGEFAAAVSFATVAGIALGPINGTVARFTAQYANLGAYGKIRTLAREITGRVARYSLVGVVVGLLLLKPLAVWLQFRSLWPLVLAYAMVVLSLLLSVVRGVLRGAQTYGLYSTNTILEAVVRLGVGVLLLGWACNVAAGLAAYVAALALTLVLAHAQLRRLWPGAAPERLDGGPIARYTALLCLMMLASAGFQNIDMLLVKAYFPEAPAGIYGAAFTLTRTMSVIVTPFDTLLLPLLTGLHARGQAIGATFVRVCAYFVLLAAAPTLLFGLWGEGVTRLAYDASYLAAAPLLMPLMLARLAGMLAGMIALACAAVNNFRFLWLYGVGLVVQVAALVLWHGSLASVVTLLIVVQAGVLIALAAFVACLAYGRGPRNALAT